MNVFSDIKENQDVVSKFRAPKANSFCAVNYFGAKSFQQFFKNRNLGIHSFWNYVKEACKAAGVVEEGVHDQVVQHRVRGSVVTLLFERGRGMRLEHAGGAPR